MPVELTERQLRDAVAVIGERHEHGGQAAESALGWLGWEGEGPLLLRRYDVQQFAWYTLPRKFLTDLEHKRQTARAYAEVCRSQDTRELLRAWEHEDPAAWQRFRELLDASGLEPPDTDLLAWGRVMGFDEARVRDLVATALEQAIEDGRLTPGARGFRRAQGEIADAALLEPWEDDPCRSRLQAIHAERLDCWVKRGSARGSTGDCRSRCCPQALEPVLWLLDRAASGIALTQTGALNRALVREVATRWPSWWPADLFGAPNREDDVNLLAELHELLRRLGLLRRTGRRLTATRRARALAADPPALLRALTRPLVADDNFDAACCELAVALILNDATADYTSSLASHVYPGASPRAGTRTANRLSESTSAGRLPTSSAPPKPSACSNPHPRARAGARPVLS